MGIKDILGKIRGWVDEEDPAQPVGEKRRGPSKWEEFLVAVARGIEEVMEEELFTPPGGPTYIPREYVVFLSRDDDAEWQGEKRQGLERGLHNVVAERARELAGANDLQTRTVAIELRVDPSLEKGKFKVKPVWDGKPEVTTVTPRATPPTAPPSTVPPPTAPVVDPLEAPTIVKPRATVSLDEDATLVRPRAPLFSVTVSRNGAVEATHPIHKSTIGIGRGAGEDIRLEGDMEISRSHVRLERTEEGKFFLTCLGRNSVFVGDREIVTDAREEVPPGAEIILSTFTLKIDNGK